MLTNALESVLEVLKVSSPALSRPVGVQNGVGELQDGQTGGGNKALESRFDENVGKDLGESSKTVVALQPRDEVVEEALGLEKEGGDGLAEGLLVSVPEGCKALGEELNTLGGDISKQVDESQHVRDGSLLDGNGVEVVNEPLSDLLLILGGELSKMTRSQKMQSAESVLSSRSCRNDGKAGNSSEFGDTDHGRDVWEANGKVSASIYTRFTDF